MLPAKLLPTLLLAIGLFAQATAPAVPGLDEFAQAALEEWKVPGFAAAVVKDGEVVLTQGYGRRDVEKQLSVTPRTLFAIGSITKSFTVAALGTLVDEKKLDWDKRLREYLPDFRLNDVLATEYMSPRDLVTHRSGLPRHDLLWYGGSLSRRQMYERLHHLEFSKDFRSAYQYNNLMFMTAGILAERVSGKSWEQLVRDRILDPLGMKASNYSVEASQKNDDFSRPYSEVKDTLRAVPFRNLDEICPAGCINSNAEEMSRYLLFHLNEGEFDGKRILSKAQIMQMHSPQMVTPPAPLRYKEAGHSSYGLGLSIGTYQGRKVVEHGGGIDGFSALLGFLPQEKIGVVVLSNRSGTPLPGIVARYIYDRMLGLEPVDWTARTKAEQAKRRAEGKQRRKKELAARKQGTRPSHELKEYAGEFEHAAYGTLRVTLEERGLSAHFNGMRLPLQHVHYDTFEGEVPELGDQKLKLSFLLDLAGDVDRLEAPLEPAVKPIVFTRSGVKPALRPGAPDD